MRWRSFRRAFLGTGIVGFLALAPQTVFGQVLITEESLNEWFFSRLIWAIGIGFFIGLAISMADLCRLPFPYKGALNVNARARRKLTIWLLIVFLIGAVLLFIDAWFVFPFGPASLEFGEVFTQIWSNYRMIVVLMSMILVLILVVGLSTRLRPSCRCRYAFIPK